MEEGMIRYHHHNQDHGGQPHPSHDAIVAETKRRIQSELARLGRVANLEGDFSDVPTDKLKKVRVRWTGNRGRALDTTAIAAEYREGKPVRILCEDHGCGLARLREALEAEGVELGATNKAARELGRLNGK
jgi:hypothetical protein